MIKGLCIHYIDSSLENLFLESGAKWLRSDIGTSAWDNLYNFAKKNNIALLGILDYNIVGNNFTLGDWKTAVEDAVKKYDCEAYEIWNEPFANYSKKGYQDGSPSHYFNLTKTAFEIIKNLRPRSIVVGGGGIYAGEENWAREIQKLGIENYVDAISLHIYWSVPQYLAWFLQFFYSWYINDQISTYKKIFEVPLWVTETGMQFTQCDWMDSLPKDMLITWYEFQDNDGQWGIVDKNGKKKHSFECFKRW